MSSPRRRRPLSRREFLARMGSLSAAAWASPLWAPGYRAALAATRGTARFPEGTTLERSIVTGGDGPYFRLSYGPPWPIRERADLAEPKRGREDRRAPLATILHFTDFQFPDAQSPARVEFLSRYADEPFPNPLAGAFRPQEALVLHACEALVRRSNALGRGPVTGRPYDCCVSTGDNFDNKQLNELTWFLRLMAGEAELAANSGADDAFEGVQGFDEPEYYDPHYYHPEAVDDPSGRSPDNYKRSFGYPDYPGLLDAAIRPFDAEGIGVRWFSVYGNHDALVHGNEPSNPFFEGVATGPVKILHPPPGWAPGDFWRGLMDEDPEAIAAFHLAPAREVTPDPDRRFVSGREYVERHRADTLGSGPPGHGFTEENEAEATLYYTFEVAPQVLGITLDTTSPWSAFGSIGETQLGWLEERLVEAHSRYYEPDGTEVRTAHDDRLVVVFSHHRTESMEPVQGPDEEGRLEQRHDGGPVLEVLHRFPNVVAWVNGHRHFNRIVPRHDPAGRGGGFWDVTTSAQVDAPQHARIIEIVDNRDGTLSIFTTMVDHEAPPRIDEPNYSLLDLATISRELSYNDPQSELLDRIGKAKDLNAELLLVAPFDLDPAADPGDDGAADDAVTLPTTGGGGGAGFVVTAAGAALGAAVALRRRGERAPGPPEAEGPEPGEPEEP